MAVASDPDQPNHSIILYKVDKSTYITIQFATTVKFQEQL